MTIGLRLTGLCGVTVSTALAGVVLVGTTKIVKGSFRVLTNLSEAWGESVYMMCYDDHSPKYKREVQRIRNEVREEYRLRNPDVCPYVSSESEDSSDEDDVEEGQEKQT